MHKYIVLLSIFLYTRIDAISIVYNFRIAQITKQPISDQLNNKNHTAIALLFDQYQKKYNDIHQNFAGGLGAYIYNFKPYYVRVDAAVSHIHEGLCKTTTFAGTETDDLLFTAGRNFIVNNRAIMTLSGLFGIPTHKIYRLRHVDFGYSQVGMGVQWDGSYALNDTSSFLYGTRYIYFVPRSACDIVRNKYTFTIGNIGDLLVGLKNNWGSHGLEYGYTARFQFGAHICPNLDDIIKKTDYIRSNFYLVYKYKFLINNLPSRVLFNIGYGFDQNPKIFSNKYVLILWGSFNINF